jgi:parallel beta-helix repeat protein
VGINGYYGAAAYVPVGYDNADFITIQAAPGQKPVLDSLAINGGGKWAFRGLTVTNLASGIVNGNAHGYLVAFGGPHHDIIFDGNTVGISYPTNTNQAHFHATVTQAEWLANAPSGVYDYGGQYDGGKCVTITNNTIRDVSFGIDSQRSNTVLIANNTIDYFAHDGIDYGSNNATIRGNLITNHLDAGDSFNIHPDFIQGQPWGSGMATVDHLSNLVITGNVGIRQTDPNLPFMNLASVTDWIQGMDTFDGDWTNVTVTNNVVVTNIYQGISFYGVHNAVIANNTVVSDGLAGGQTPWITVMPAKAVYGGAPSSDVVIKNNVANVITPDASTINLTVENNLVVEPVGGGSILEIPVNGAPTWNGKPGTYGSNNVISATNNATAFKAYSPLTGTFDLHLSSAIAGLGALSVGSVGAYGTGN